MIFNSLSGILGDSAAATRIAKQIVHGIQKSDLVGHLKSPIRAKQLFNHRLKVFHVRSEDDWLARQCRLDRILSADTGEAFADENNGS
jgi:hypothetical protein